MAKSGFWLRGANGKLAGASIAKGADGSTVIREIVTPKNPQTEAQKIQRIIMATVTKAYAIMKGITDHSFEGLSMGAKCMNRFNQLNAAMLRQKVSSLVAQGYALEEIFDFNKGDNRLTANEWIISSGSLPQVPVELVNNSAAIAISLTNNTYQGIIDAFRLKRGDQITLIGAIQDSNANMEFHFSRIILDPTNEDGSQAALSEALIVGGAVNKPSLRNEIDERMVIAYADSQIQFKFADADGFEGVQALGGVVVSRKENDKWLRSACQLAASDVVDNATSMAEAIANFGSVSVPVSSEQFLNNAGTGGTANTNQSGGGSDNNGGGGGGSNTPVVALPNISGDTPFPDTSTVTITAAAGAEIHYTIDGSTPTAASPVYSTALTLTDTTTVKAIAIVDGVSSEVASKTFTKGDEESDMN